MKKGKRKTDAERLVAAVFHHDPSAFHRTEPSFETNDKDYLLIAEIAKRAVRLGMELEVKVDCTEMSMDITACHANGNPLRLEELLKADNGNFGHDVFGIRRFIDRKTGKLQDFFRPRYSAIKGEKSHE